MEENTTIYRKSSIYFIRAKRIRSFHSHYPDIDLSKVFAIELKDNLPRLDNGNFISRFTRQPLKDMRIKIIDNTGATLYPNPTTIDGWWYVEQSNYKYIFSDTVDLANVDTLVTKYYLINISYVNNSKYRCNTKRTIAISKEEAEKLGIQKSYDDTYVMVESKSNENGYEFAKIRSINARESLPTESNLLDRKIIAGPLTATRMYHIQKDKNSSALQESFGHIASVNTTDNKICGEDTNVFGSKLKDIEKIKELEATIIDLKLIIAERDLEIYKLKKVK